MQIGRVYDKCDTKCMSVMMRWLCCVVGQSTQSVGGRHAIIIFLCLILFVSHTKCCQSKAKEL